jgi:hypothetical protein
MFRGTWMPRRVVQAPSEKLLAGRAMACYAASRAGATTVNIYGGWRGIGGDTTEWIAYA